MQIKDNTPTPTPSNPVVSTTLLEIHWDRKSINFGEVAAGSSQDFTFKYLGNKTIRKVNSSCGCTVTTTKNNLISGTWSIAQDFSGVKNNRMVPSSKTLTVLFEDSTRETLTISATINKNYKIHK